jgi:hypothetical protein
MMPASAGIRALTSCMVPDVREASTVELPIWLFWSSADHTFDLSRPFMLRSMYETVLREAARPEDLTTYLNGETLAAVWPDLHLPKGVRLAWEERHPELQATAAA